MEGGASRRRRGPGPARRRLGLAPVEEGPQAGGRPAADTRKSLPDRFDAELQVVAVLPADTGAQRAAELLEPVALAYRHFDNPAGARFKVGKVKPVVPDPSNLHPAGPGLFGRRSVLGVREAAALWHPPGAGDETPLVEHSGARGLTPSARGVRGGALVGDTTAGKPMPIRFPRTCCAVTTSTWPAPAWASPPSCTTSSPTR